MKTLIISGGQIDIEFLKQFVAEKDFEKIVGVDKGIETCYKCNITPTILMGDFDSAKNEILKHYEVDTNLEILYFTPEKDDTDTQMAIKWAIDIGSTQIAIIGATGSRIDHLLGNIQCLCNPLKKNIECYLIDRNNKIMLINHSITIQKDEQYGTFLSLLALTNEVTGLTINGFKYPLSNYTLTNQAGGFGVSNEIVDEIAEIIFQTGILIMIQSRD
ncbi:MAG: thiamine diphosphokinase [Lachnotalea sp.]